MKPSKEAIEAAAKIIASSEHFIYKWDEWSEDGRQRFRELAEATLIAALPHLLLAETVPSISFQIKTEGYGEGGG